VLRDLLIRLFFSFQARQLLRCGPVEAPDPTSFLKFAVDQTPSAKRRAHHHKTRLLFAARQGPIAPFSVAPDSTRSSHLLGGPSLGFAKRTIKPFRPARVRLGSDPNIVSITPIDPIDDATLCARYGMIGYIRKARVQASPQISECMVT